MAYHKVKFKMIEFGKLLQKLRLESGMSIRKLASLVDPSHISRIERGENNPPKRITIDRLAKILKLDEEKRKQLYEVADYIPEINKNTREFVSSLSNDQLNTKNILVAEQVGRLRGTVHRAVKDVVDLLTQDCFSESRKSQLAKQISVYVQILGSTKGEKKVDEE